MAPGVVTAPVVLAVGRFQERLRQRLEDGVAAAGPHSIGPGVIIARSYQRRYGQSSTKEFPE